MPHARQGGEGGQDGVLEHAACASGSRGRRRLWRTRGVVTRMPAGVDAQLRLASSRRGRSRGGRRARAGPSGCLLTRTAPTATRRARRRSARKCRWRQWPQRLDLAERIDRSSTAPAPGRRTAAAAPRAASDRLQQHEAYARCGRPSRARERSRAGACFARGEAGVEGGRSSALGARPGAAAAASRRMGGRCWLPRRGAALGGASAMRDRRGRHAQPAWAQRVHERGGSEGQAKRLAKRGARMGPWRSSSCR
jgi:hypothetical protein